MSPSKRPRELGPRCLVSQGGWEAGKAAVDAPVRDARDLPGVNFVGERGVGGGIEGGPEGGSLVLVDKDMDRESEGEGWVV